MFAAVIITVFYFWAAIPGLLVAMGLPLEVAPQGVDGE